MGFLPDHKPRQENLANLESGAVGSELGTPESLGSDCTWDSFLERSPLGQFQQTSGWARIKARDGWKTERCFLSASDSNRGGLQLLWKQSRFGRIGYVSKGPVLDVESPAAVDRILCALKATAARLQLRALLLQPPDVSTISPEVLVRHGFGRSPVEDVIRATAVVDVSEGREAFMNRMTRRTRKEARQAAGRQILVRRGDRSDMRLFFELMAHSCRRQNTIPNPSRPELLESLWDELSPRVSVWLASCGHETLAGILMISHGQRLTLWKKGWNAQEAHSEANCLLVVEALRWACDQGLRCVDFAAFDPAMAESVLAGRPLTEAQKRTRYVFSLRLGARPMLLPPARLLIVNPALRTLFRLASKSQRFEQAVMGRIRAV